MEYRQPQLDVPCKSQRPKAVHLHMSRKAGHAGLLSAGNQAAGTTVTEHWLIFSVVPIKQYAATMRAIRHDAVG